MLLIRVEAMFRPLVLFSRQIFFLQEFKLPETNNDVFLFLHTTFYSLDDVVDFRIDDTPIDSRSHSPLTLKPLSSYPLTSP